MIVTPCMIFSSTLLTFSAFSELLIARYRSKRCGRLVVVVQSNGSNGFGVTKTSSSLADRLTCFFLRRFVAAGSMNNGIRGGLINGNWSLGEIGAVCADCAAKSIRVSNGCKPLGKIAESTSGLDLEFDSPFCVSDCELDVLLD